MDVWLTLIFTVYDEELSCFQRRSGSAVSIFIYERFERDGALVVMSNSTKSTSLLHSVPIFSF